MGVSPKWVKSKRRRKKKERKRRERLNDGNNNGQLRIANATSGGAGARKDLTPNHKVREASKASIMVNLRIAKKNKQ